MPWSTSDRNSRLPRDWHKRRAQVKRRADGQCEALVAGVRCPMPGRDCDHIIPSGSDDLDNLQLLCVDHHKAKTAREAAAAKPSRNRAPERHPGLL